MIDWTDVDEMEAYKDAVQEVLQIINMRVNPALLLWCDYPVISLDRYDLDEKARRDIKKSGVEIEEDSDILYVGIPQISLNRRVIPLIHFVIDLYYYKSDVDDNFYYGKVVPQADVFDIPIALIAPLIAAIGKGEKETNDAPIMEKTQSYSVYAYMGREWRIPDAFIGFAWALTEAGKNLGGLLDPISSELFEKFAREIPAPSVETPESKSDNNYVEIISALGNMGFVRDKAEKAANYVVKQFPNESLENKITKAFQYLGS